jgi:hypothetical protein
VQTSPLQISSNLLHSNQLAKDTLRGSVSAYWWLPLDSSSFRDLVNVLVDVAKKPYVNAVAYELPHPSAANYLTVELAVLEEISQSLAVLFGLNLPFQISSRLSERLDSRLPFDK